MSGWRRRVGTSIRGLHVGRAGPWLAGVLLAVLLLGPMLGSGSLLNLDLILIDPIPVPSGAWGLGPELPRRVPFMIPVAWIGAVVGAWTATRGLFVAIIVLATAGMHRLAHGLPGPVRYGLAVIYGAGPFLVTRLGIGHLSIALAAALLPWALPPLLRPTRSLSSTAVAGGALAVTGITGGTYVALAVGIGLLADRPPVRSAVRVLAVIVATQLVWIVPGLVAYSQGVDPSNSVLFGARLRGPLDVLRLTVGHGFWQDAYQVGFARLDALLAGAVLTGLAVVGARRLPDPWRTRGAALGAFAAVVVVAGAVPGLDDRVAQAVGHPLLAPLREAHRLLPLASVWILLAAGHGAARLAFAPRTPWRPVVLVAPLAVGLVVAGPGAWGLGGDLRPHHLHDDWAQVRAVVEGEAGSLVALPWAQYLDIAEFDGRRVHHPAPFALAVDVIISSDPRLGEPAQERADEREPVVARLVEEVREGEPVADDLADLGVRWVLILHTVDWQDYDGLPDDPGLRRRIDGEVLDLYEVEDPRGPLLTAEGDRAVDWVARPLGSVDAPDGGLWLGPGTDGWMRGLRPVRGEGSGRLRIPSGDGLLWYWPAVLVLLADAVAVAVVVGGVSRKNTSARRG